MVVSASRVIVSLTDPKSAENHSDLRLVDKHKLLLRLDEPESSTYRQLTFDGVGYEHEQHMGNEFLMQMDNMFQHQEDGSLIRFSPLRNYNYHLMTRILVANVDRILKARNFRIQAIHVQHYVMRKFDMVNLLGKQHTLHMTGTRELLQFLMTTYSKIGNSIKGDDYLDVRYEFKDANYQVHAVQYVIFQIFNCAARVDIDSLIRDFPPRKGCNSSLLSDCMRESLVGQKKNRALLLFELPLTGRREMWMRKVLQMAYSARNSFIRVSNEEFDNSSSSSSRKTNTKELKSRVRRNGSLSKKPKRGSSDYWLYRIDLQSKEVLRAMEEYYKKLYLHKKQLICSHWQELVSDRRIDDNQNSEDSWDIIEAKQCDALRKRYLSKLTLLRSFERESEKAPQIIPYINEKTHEIQQSDKAFKERELDSLRSDLISYISSSSSSSD